MKIIFLTLLLFLIDQLSKLFVRGFSLPLLNINHNGFNLGETKPVINNFLHITLVENPGIAFGIVPGDFLKDFILILTIPDNLNQTQVHKMTTRLKCSMLALSSISFICFLPKHSLCKSTMDIKD